VLSRVLLCWLLYSLTFICVSLAEQVTVGLDSAVATMVKGELAKVTVQFEYGFVDTEVQRQLITVPPCSTLIYEVELIDFTKVLISSLIITSCVLCSLILHFWFNMLGKRIMGDESP
jgi:hypothetical protein